MNHKLNPEYECGETAPTKTHTLRVDSVLFPEGKQVVLTEEGNVDVVGQAKTAGEHDSLFRELLVGQDG